MRVVLPLLFIIVSFPAQAVFQDIWKGYQVSKVHQSKLIDEKINVENFKFEDNKFDWQLFATPSYNHTFRDALFSFQANETITSGLSYGLSKTSYKYGTFKFEQAQLAYDLTNWSSSAIANLDSDKLYETTNTFNYSYDFFDRTMDADYELANINYQMKSLEARHAVEKGYFDFFSVYIQAKLQVYAVKLTKDFVKEAQKRVSQINKRVKDGLSRKVELLQAKSNLLNQQEALEKTRSSLKQNLAIIENLIGTKIDDKYFEKLTWKPYGFNYWKKFIKDDKSINIEILKKRLEYSEKMLEKVAEQNGQKLALTASYFMNDIDQSASKSMSNASNGERFDQRIALTWTIPLGMSKRDGLAKKSLYQHKKNELDLLSIEDEVKVKKEALIEQISYLEKAGTIANQKITIGKETLDQQNRLYLRGQASFEEVIRTEEAYINSRLSEKRLLAEYEMLIVNYAFLNNSTQSLLNSYQD